MRFVNPSNRQIKGKRLPNKNLQIIAAVAAMCLAGGSEVFATDGTWTSLTSGTWGDTANWSGGTVAAGAGGTVSTADFSTLSLPSNLTVSLDTGRTIGVLKFGDTGGVFNWTLDNNGVPANAINLLSNTYGNSTANQPTINVVNGTATISANIGTPGASPAPQWIKSGSGTVVLSGVTSFGSGFNIIGGTSASAASTVTINNASTSTGVIADANNFFGYRDINIANTTGEFGVLNLTAGTVKAPNLTMGSSGNATININGGTLSVGTRIKSSGNSNGKATINISSGNLNFVNNAFFQMGEFNGSSTVFTTINQTGGNINFYSDNGTTLGGTGYIGLASGGSHVYNLSGGTLAIPAFKFAGQAVSSFAANGTFFFKGGTLKITSSTTDFWGNTTSTSGSSWFIRSSTGGANIDTAGNNVSFGNRVLNRDPAVTTDGGLTKLDSVGSGTLTIAADAGYNGPTTVQAGKLLFSNAMPTASTNFTIASGATLEFNHSVNKSIGNANFSGAGNLIKSGSNTLLLTGASVAGTLTAGSSIDVQGGKLQLTDFNSVQSAWNSGSPNLNIAAGATLEANLSDMKVDQLTGSGTYQSGWFFYRTLTVGVNNSSSTFSGVIQNNGVGGATVGATALTKTGTGTLTLTGNNTFTGPVTLAGGTSLNPSTLTIAPTTTATIGLATGTDAKPLGMSINTGENTVLNISGGVVNASSVTIGQSGAATLNLSGGSLNSGGTVATATNNNGSAIVNVSGTGSLNLYNNAKLRFGQFFGRPTTFTQSGGNVNLYSDAGSTLGGTGSVEINSGSSIYNLNGGTLAVPQFTWFAPSGGAGGGNLTMYFNGGTLKTTATSADFFPTGHVTANVSTGGAIVDTSGNNVTINQTLAHDSSLGATPDGGLTKTGSGTLTLTASQSYTGATSANSGKLITNIAIQNGAAISVSGGAVIEVPANGTSTGVSSVSAVTNSGSGSHIELHDNDLISNYGAGPSNFTSLVSMVKSGLTLLGGSGTDGITSVEVDTQAIGGTVLAVVDDGDPNIGGGITDLSGFGIPNPTTSVLIKYTWFGDANLDGVVDGSDYALTDTGFTSGGALTGWVFGDYDYSGLVDGGDYALQDTGFIAQTGALPEPTTLGLLGLGAISLLGRRRK